MISTVQQNAKNQPAKRLVVFLHGFGSNGDDLLGLAPFFAQVDDAVDFTSPNAVQPSPYGAGAYQWFPIPYIDGSSVEEMTKGLVAAHKALDVFIDQELSARGLKEENLVLVGFSQGTMMALHTALRRSKPVAGVVGFSGRLLFPDALNAELKSKPPIVLIHGKNDDVVPVTDSIDAQKILQSAGVNCDLHLSSNTPHSIAQDGLQKAVEFYNKVRA